MSLPLFESPVSLAFGAVAVDGPVPLAVVGFEEEDDGDDPDDEGADDIVFEDDDLVSEEDDGSVWEDFAEDDCVDPVLPIWLNPTSGNETDIMYS